MDKKIPPVFLPEGLTQEQKNNLYSFIKNGCKNEDVGSELDVGFELVDIRRLWSDNSRFPQLRVYVGNVGGKISDVGVMETIEARHDCGRGFHSSRYFIQTIAGHTPLEYR